MHDRTHAADNVAQAPRNTIRLHSADNVVVAREALGAGVPIEGEGMTAAVLIPAGHKIATAAIAAGEPVRKYDQIIGFARIPIAPGEHVHVHNVEMREFERDYAPGADRRVTRSVTGAQQAGFAGFVRASGKVGTRNYVGILTSVNCSATVARAIAKAFEAPEALAAWPNVDGVVAFPHGTGCGMVTGSDGYAILQRVLRGYSQHANFGGVLLIGLGCEVVQVGGLLEHGMPEPGPGLHTMTIQDAGGTRRAIDEGIARVRAMLEEANRVSRQQVPASHLMLALQCGGSDGYSGITANPALGAAVDLLVQHGGTAILSETPEIYGAEHLLVRRANSPEAARKLLARIEWWRDYTRRNGAEMNNNPAPGNKAGGLTTILEKALGSAAKGGTTNLIDVYEYAEPVTSRGFVFMDSPGFDPASATGQVASGANILCFTTGRGSVFGCKPTPSIKLATNSSVYARMRDDMDVNCGAIADGNASVAGMGEQIFRLILDVASGRRTKSEDLGFGENEFVPWQVGAVL